MIPPHTVVPSSDFGSVGERGDRIVTRPLLVSKSCRLDLTLLPVPRSRTGITHGAGRVRLPKPILYATLDPTR